MKTATAGMSHSNAPSVDVLSLPHCQAWHHERRTLFKVDVLQVHELQDVGGVYTQLMAVLSLLAERGLVHCDCNEFNVLVRMLPSPNHTVHVKNPSLNWG